MGCDDELWVGELGVGRGEGWMDGVRPSHSTIALCAGMGLPGCVVTPAGTQVPGKAVGKMALADGGGSAAEEGPVKGALG